MITLSIVIPIYNVESYLKQCLDSVVKQICSDTEVILINDGSTDNSNLICEEYEKKYNEIKYFEKTNGGLSDARNYGLKKCKGKYVMFLDSDDFLPDNTIGKILKLIRNDDKVDLIIHCYNEYLEAMNEFIQKRIFSEKINFCKYYMDNSIKKQLFKEAENLWPAWKNVSNIEFLNNNKLYFKKGFLHEDVEWTTKLLVKSKSILYVEDNMYNYRVNRKSSIMNSRGYKSIRDVALIFIDIKTYLIENNIDVELRNIILDRISRSFYTTLRYYKNCNKDEKKEINNIIKKDKDILSYSILKKHKIFYKLSRVIGIKIALYLYNSLY